MYVSDLELSDFRNYEHVVVSFPPGVTTIYGPNGQGKTNLVEAIGFAASLRSHRVNTDAPLIRAGAQTAIVRVAAVTGTRRNLVELAINQGRANQGRLNRAPVTRVRDVLGIVRRVIFAPEDLSLVKGDPADRRAFLDDLLVSLTPRLEGLRADLDRVLRQRNSLLKSAAHVRGSARAAALNTLEVWDDQYVPLAAQLTAARLRLVDRLSEPLAQAYADVAGPGRGVAAGAVYQSKLTELTPQLSSNEIATTLRGELTRRRDEEFSRGLTLVGPQRDDLAISVGGLPVKGYASHGESWSMALALRLASFAIQRSEAPVDGAPLLVLDDVFAELDAQRRDRLGELALRAEQVLVTAAVREDVPSALHGRSIQVSEGRVSDG